MDAINNIFKAYDVRGRVGSELTADVAHKIGQAFANWLPTEGPVAVGRDMRPDSAELAAAAIEGIRAAGRDVQDIGEVTSDMIYFAVGSGKLAGGMMITASHNPGEYNGIKLCREEARPVGEATGLYEIRDRIIAGKFQTAKQPGTVTQTDITEAWIQHALSFIDANKLKELKIAVDAGNGMAGKIFPELEPYVPFEVTELYFDLDGTFPNHIANPLEAKNLIDLQKAIQEHGCDAGVAFDGDGDRAVLLDENGEPLSGTVLTALLAQYFLQQHPGETILLNAICGQAASEMVEKSGGTWVRTRVGHSFIKGNMREHNAVFAGEHSGHYYFRDNYCADSGLIAAVIGLYILSTSGKTLSELVAPLRKAYLQIPETNFEVADKQGTIDRVAVAFPENEHETLDGLTIRFDDQSWCNVRPSNTEPLLRLNAEAKTQARLDELVAHITKLINRV
ncbi:MAG TPA: phosphomannomutase/phosphoglucomutase [Candidatus Saccharimonadales bacterium]|nr:phosphomannomutase/phosphoglucomutase [Candidatus Saccharimonadales bacterium]